MNNDEVYEFENQVYVNPTQSRDEQLQFVENLRDVQTANNQQIAEDTYNLGTQVPTNLGGLTSGAANPNSYWMSRYQTPQVQSQVANLVAAAQADALQNILSQDQSQYQNRANQAYRNYQKRQRARASSGSGSGNSNNTIAPGGDFTTKGKVKENPIQPEMSLDTPGGSLTITAGSGPNAGNMMVIAPPALNNGTLPNGYWVINNATGEREWMEANN